MHADSRNSAEVSLLNIFRLNTHYAESYFCCTVVSYKRDLSH